MFAILSLSNPYFKPKNIKASPLPHKNILVQCKARRERATLLDETIMK
jgi:hypothetical protein